MCIRDRWWTTPVTSNIWPKKSPAYGTLWWCCGMKPTPEGLHAVGVTSRYHRRRWYREVTPTASKPSGVGFIPQHHQSVPYAGDFFGQMLLVTGVVHHQVGALQPGLAINL